MSRCLSLLGLCIGVKCTWQNIPRVNPFTSAAYTKLSCEVIHVSMPKKVDGNQVCGRGFLPGLPPHYSTDI